MTSEKNETESEPAPDILYKYADWDNEYHKRLITSPEVYLSSPADFNDPYDCTVKSRYDLWSQNEWTELYYKDFINKYPEHTEKDLNIAAEKLYFEIHEFETNHENALNRITNNQNSHFMNNIGIFSLSKIKDNLLMWSHYANSHKGVCIGYDKALLRDFIKNFYSEFPPKTKYIDYFECRYKSDYPENIPSTEMGNPFEYFKRLEIKFSGWEYEQEWRLAVNQNEPLYQRTVQLPIDVIKEVYLGLRISKANTSNILFELKKQNYKGKIFKAVQDENEFKLNFIELII